MSDPASVIFTIPPGCVGFIGSPGEFLRAEKFGPRLAGMASAETLPLFGGRRELRLFQLPPDVTLRGVNRIPGFNIRVLHPGAQVAIQVVDTSDN